MPDTQHSPKVTADISNAPPVQAPALRSYGAFNWLGLWTLYKREVARFVTVWKQTLVAPIIQTLLFMTVFQLAFGNRGNLSGDFEGLAYGDFLAPGLLIMAILQNSFANSSSSLVISKVQGSHVDFLMPPLSPLELTIGFVCGAATRGLLVALIAGIAIHISPLADLPIKSPLAVLWFGFCAAIMLAAFGVIGGIWADKFDNLATITNFVIVPLTFLSGTFYDINVLTEPFITIALFDPFFYLIDGFRFGFLEAANSNLVIGAMVAGALAVATSAAVWWMFRTGYKLKA
ncbi:MAG: ABC transporter permease [Pseudomonadota bacterium]